MTPLNEYLIITDLKEETATASGLIISHDMGAAKKASVVASSVDTIAEGSIVYYPEQAVRKLYDDLKVIKSEAVFAVDSRSDS